MRKPFVVLAITLLTLVLVGGAALAQTGSLAIWSAASEEEAQALVAEFKKLYPGIAVDLIRAGSGELLTRMQAEAPRPGGDIILGIAKESLDAVYDLLEPYKAANHDEIPENLRDSADVPRYYGYSMPLQAFMVNTDLLAPEDYPKTWKDLADPKYKGEIILANRAAADLWDLPEDVIGQNLFDATRHEELMRILEKTMDARETFTSEVRVRPGSERTVAITSSPLQDEKGKIQGAVAVMRDVTSLRHLEQMRQEFVSNVSHELRTPLTSIKGFVETLLNGHLDDQQLLERFLRIIAAETDRMIALINDLLDLSRIESGKLKVNKAAVDMKKIFDDTVLLLQSRAEEKQITLENNIYNPIIVEGDEKLLRQVALNLVDNGVKYTQEGGRVWIEAEEGLDHVEFIVGDNGVGIPSEHLDRIFERFYRVDKGRSRQTGGTGLGLAIVKHIIDRHKGTIAIESRVGKGTKIRITLKKIS